MPFQKLKSPWPVLNQLEINEKDKTKFLGYVPIIGMISDYIIDKINFFKTDNNSCLLTKKDTKCTWCDIKDLNYSINEKYEICVRYFCRVIPKSVISSNFDEHTLYRRNKRSCFCKKCGNAFFMWIGFICEICDKFFCFSCIEKECNLKIDLKKIKYGNEKLELSESYKRYLLDENRKEEERKIEEERQNKKKKMFLDCLLKT